MNAVTILSIILGVVSLGLAIASIVIVFVNRGRDTDLKVREIENRLETFNRTAQDILNRTSKVTEEIDRLHDSSQHLRPELSTFLLTQWRFVEKVFHYRFEKHSIARTVTKEYIQDNMRILLDSGSTTDLITYELLENPVRNVHVYSNNVFAAMHLVGTNEVIFNLLSGRFNEHFAAVYSDEANKRIEQLDFDLFVLASTALTFETGIMVHKSDIENYHFKNTALKAFIRTLNTGAPAKLLIAADASKFFEPADEKRGVVSPDEWAEIISKGAAQVVVVTSPAAPDFTRSERAAVEEQIRKFEHAGIQVMIYEAS